MTSIPRSLVQKISFEMKNVSERVKETIQSPERPGMPSISPFCNTTCRGAAEDKALEPSFSATAPLPACLGRDVVQLCLDAGMPLKAKPTERVGGPERNLHSS